MPEGPEIRKVADRVEAAVVATPLQEVFFAFDHLKNYQAELQKAVVQAIDTYGKAMVMRFDNGLCVYSHNQLYGKWLIRNAYNYPKTNRQLRLALHTEKKSALLYSASDIEVLNVNQVSSHPFISRLGPDVMHQGTTPEQVQIRACSDKFRRRGFKNLLLEQSFLAGIGNYLRSEILFVAGIHPLKRPLDCTDAQLRRFSEAALDIPRQSYRHNGITTDLELAQQLKLEGQSRSLYRHWVFNRGGKPCRKCGSIIIKEVQGRRYYYCPQCQPETSPTAD